MEVRPNQKSQAMASSSGRPLRLQKRIDLEVQHQTYQGRDYWVVKDPIGLKFYRFEEEEYSLLQMIDGQASPDQIKRRFDYQFAPQKITMQELYQFVGMLYRSSLLISNSPDQGVELLARGKKTKAGELRQSLTNVLAIRYKGFDPDRLLGHMNRWLGWFFTIPAFLIVLMLGLSALGLIVAQFEMFQTKLPSFYDFFAAKNWFWLAIVMAGTKVIHEFGHGLACKRFGGQCHEMGLMLLVLTPCLYVNVSDSWLLKSKWKRALIAAAGMYVELVLASIAVFIWWFSQPGLVNQLALNVIFVSSVSTLLFNANPLLRYDGYYILSDTLEIPNLRSKATTILQRTCGQLFLGIDARPDPFLPPRHRWLFGLYSVAAALYRWFITFSIFWFVYRVLEPYGFKIVGQMIALMAIYGLIGMPLVQLYKFFSVPGRFGVVKPIRATISTICVLAIVGGVMLIPIPHYVTCVLQVQAAGAKNVYVDVPGSLAEIYAVDNQFVKEGDPIIRLHSQDLRVQLASLRSDVEGAMVRVSNIRRASSSDESLGEGLESAIVAKKASLANYQKRVLDEDRLLIRAETSGYFVGAPRVEESDSDPKTLEFWSGSPLDPRNLESYLEQSTMVGQIVPDLSKLEAVLAIDQADIEFIKSEQSVEILINQVPCTIFYSRTDIVTPTEMESTPKALSSRHGGEIITTTGAQGKEVPSSTKYLVKVRLNDPEQRLVSGSTGLAKIRTGSQTIGQRIIRLFNRTFQFEL